MVLRPQAIRQACSQLAREEAVKSLTKEQIADEAERQQMQADYEALAESECLEQKGLKR